MSTATVADLNAAHGVTLVTDYADDLTVPVSTGLQRQGDVIVVPDPALTATTQVPSTGCPVVRGENGGNTHAIYTDAGSGVACDTSTPTATSLRVAVLTVPAGATAYLGHPEHGYLGIGPGSYEIRRQREMADELRLIAD